LREDISPLVPGAGIGFLLLPEIVRLLMALAALFRKPGEAAAAVAPVRCCEASMHK